MKFFRRFFILLCFSLFWIFYLKAKMQYIKESLFAMQCLILNDFKFFFKKAQVCGKAGAKHVNKKTQTVR